MTIEALQTRDGAGRGAEAPNPAATRVASAGGQPSPQGGKALPHARDGRSAREAAEVIDRFLRDSGRQFAFSVDEVTGQTVVSIRDAATGDLIRQLPSEEALRIARNLSMAAPKLVSERA